MLPEAGLSLAARCLSAARTAGDTRIPPGLLAATLDYEIARRGRVGGNYAEIAARHDVDGATLRTAVATLRPRLPPDL